MLSDADLRLSGRTGPDNVPLCRDAARSGAVLRLAPFPTDLHWIARPGSFRAGTCRRSDPVSRAEDRLVGFVVLDVPETAGALGGCGNWERFNGGGAAEWLGFPHGPDTAPRMRDDTCRR